MVQQSLFRANKLLIYFGRTKNTAEWHRTFHPPTRRLIQAPLGKNFWVRVRVGLSSSLHGGSNVGISNVVHLAELHINPSSFDKISATDDESVS